MKKVICVLVLLVLLVCLTGTARASVLPKELLRAAPVEMAEVLEESDVGIGTFQNGLVGLWEQATETVGGIFRSRLRDVVLLLLIVLLCGVVDGTFQGTGAKRITNYTPMAGALSITLLSAGSLHSLIGLGAETIAQLSTFSKVLLPTLAAATAASGSIGRATVQQVGAVFFVDVLLTLINGLLLPLVYLYIGAITASAMLPANQLGGVAEALKKIITWLLTGAMVLFTGYLTLTNVISGATDAATVKLAKAAISGVVPVVGSIIADASETVLAGAGLLKNTIGVFGMLAVLSMCLLPFLQLGIQYLLYKLASFVSATVGAAPMVKLLSGLGGAFGLVLGMTGACALLLTVSILASVAAVVP